MTWTATDVLGVTVTMVMIVIVAAMALALLRLAKGPTLPDRVVALDVVANLAVAVIAACAIAFDEALLLQPVLTVALIAFVGTVAFACHLERTRS
jgi:multicomponent Na+:H+ antiporter subunit F